MPGASRDGSKSCPTAPLPRRFFHAAVGYRGAAEALRGCRIFVPRSSFPSTQPDEYYWVDLMGCEVVNREGVALGQVQDLLSTGLQSVLVLHQKQDGRTLERMIPFVSAYIDEVDLNGRLIRVDWQTDY